MFSKLSFQKKLVLYYSLLMVIIIAFSNSFFYIQTSKIIEKNITDNIEELANKVSAQLDFCILELDRVAIGILGNTDLLSILIDANKNYHKDPFPTSSKHLAQQRTIDNMVFTLNTPKLTASRVSIFNSEKGFFYTSGHSAFEPNVVRKNLKKLEWEEKVIKKWGAKAIIPVHSNSWSKEGELVCSVSRLVRTPKGEILGIIEVQQPYDKFFDILKMENDNWHIYVYDDEGSIIYPLKTENDEHAKTYSLVINNIKHPQSSTVKDKASNQLLYYSINNSEYTGWNIIVGCSQINVLNSLSWVKNVSISLGGLTILLTIGIIYIISRSLSLPIKELRDKVQKITIDNMNLSVSNNAGNDEVNQLNSSFINMLGRIEQSLNETLIAKEEEKKAYIYALQSQMNPHFLYNTINTIGFVAEEKNQPEIAGICRQLVSMLRYVTGFEDSIVTLHDELTYAENYLNLMRLRYESRLFYKIDVEGDPKSIKVPKLIIQPLIENAIKHGLSPVNYQWRIIISVYVSKDYFKVMITDNGIGFDEKFINQLKSLISSYKACGIKRDNLQNYQSNKIGIINTYVRLLYLFGDDIDLRISNKDDSGAVVIIESQTLNIKEQVQEK